MATIEKPPTSLAGHAAPLNDLDAPTGQREQQVFAVLVAQLRQRGYVLVKTDPVLDSQPPYLVVCEGAAHAFGCLEEVREGLESMPVEEPGNG